MKTWNMMRPWLLRGKKIENKKSEESPKKTKKGLKAGKMKYTVCLI